MALSALALPALESGACRLEQEAAILHAAGFDEAAVTLLLRELASSPAPMDKRVRTMLLEIYRSRHDRVRFDAARAECIATCGPPVIGWDDAVGATGALGLDGVLAHASGAF